MVPARASSGENEWTLVHVVRCHARGVSSTDARVKVWGAAFLPNDTDWPMPAPAPDGGDPLARSVLVATAGENSLAIQDARTGEVVLKYRHPEREDFYCVVATVAEQPRRDGSGAAPWRLPIVAAAGGAGTVKLVSPAHRVVYAELRGHKKNINGLVVHPHHPRELFSASSDGTIMAWDIGALDQAADPARISRMVAEYTAASAPVVSVAVHADRGWLLSGNEDGTVAVYTIVEKGTVRPLVRLKHDTFLHSTVDLLESLGDRLVVAKGASDGRLIVWDVVASVTERRPVVHGAVPYCDTDIFFVKGCARPVDGKWLVAVGTPDGDIRLHTLDAAEWENAAPAPAAYTTTVLRSTGARGLIRKVDIAPDGQHLVAVTDNNYVLLWHRTALTTTAATTNRRAARAKPSQ